MRDIQGYMICIYICNIYDTDIYILIYYIIYILIYIYFKAAPFNHLPSGHSSSSDTCGSGRTKQGVLADLEVQANLLGAWWISNW